MILYLIYTSVELSGKYEKTYDINNSNISCMKVSHY
jgi:hypothetical protein